MFQTRTCEYCFHVYEYYQRHSLVPECPKCGGHKRLTAKQYYKSIGIDYVKNSNH